ncbi:MAG: hypothetical protein WD601_06920 [Pseudohongiellaceae bacterium]
MLKSISKSLGLATILLCAASPTYAYLDPGTGSMILQGLIAGVAVASLTVKTWWYQIKGLFSGKADESPEQDKQEKSDSP